MEMYYGADEGGEEEITVGSPGAVVAEALTNIRTVASLTLERNRSGVYSRSLASENKSALGGIVKKGEIGSLLFRTS